MITFKNKQNEEKIYISMKILYQISSAGRLRCNIERTCTEFIQNKDQNND
eukprot:UN02209